MSVYVKVIGEKDYPILRNYLERDGYDFGGEADKFVDLVQSEQHFAVEEIRRLRRE